MKLKTLLKNVAVQKIVGKQNLTVKSLHCSSAEQQQGGMFFCLVGLTTDGHLFANEALHNGAAVLVVERELPNITATQIVVPNTRIAMSHIAKNFYHAACDNMKIICLVGTNGKTSISYMLKAMLDKQGIKNAVIGTNGTKVGDLTICSHLTTPDPIELHYLFLQLHQLEVKVVVMEASAQAIYFNKLYGITSEIAIFTNLSNEHLDFFKSYENYEQTKVSFFNNNTVKTAILNADSPTTFEIVKNYKNTTFTYGLYNPASTFAIDITTSLRGSKFVVNANDQIFEIKTRFIGVHNVYNLLAAITCAMQLGCSVENIVQAVATMPEIAGRMNVMHLDCNNKVVVDYAHTPDGFYQVLSLLRALRQGNIVCVFGCVGYSDPIKRMEMGTIASRYCDKIILTADNPNFTSFETINSDIVAGFGVFTNYEEIFDREQAIQKGFSYLQKNDTLVILGKGAETVNKIAGKEVLQSDLHCVQTCVEKHYHVVKTLSN